MATKPTKQINVKLETGLLERIDKARTGQGRNAWIAAACEAALTPAEDKNEISRAAPPASRPPTAPRPRAGTPHHVGVSRKRWACRHADCDYISAAPKACFRHPSAGIREVEM
jgi:hypothetical protein